MADVVYIVSNERQAKAVLAELRQGRRPQTGWSPADLIAGPVGFLVDVSLTLLERGVTALVDLTARTIARQWRRVRRVA
jgi:hypothetical protein